MAQQIVMPTNRLTAMTTATMTSTSPRSTEALRALWLVRPRSDGGSDYVSFVPSPGGVEMREGSHLPPQMPLLKRRRRLAAEEAEVCQSRLQQEAGFRHSDPLF
jgi:hypothetical protein